MRSATREFVDEIKLTPDDEQKYEEILTQLYTPPAPNTYYNTLLASDEYSYDIKQKLVLTMASMEHSRLWGLGNLSAQALFLFIFEVFTYEAKDLSFKEIQALVANPACDGSVSGVFNIPRIAFVLASGYTIEKDLQKHVIMMQLLEANKMNLEIAAIVMEIIRQEEDLEGNRVIRESFATPVLNWARTNFALNEEIPDSWVREFLVKVAS